VKESGNTSGKYGFSRLMDKVKNKPKVKIWNIVFAKEGTLIFLQKYKYVTNSLVKGRSQILVSTVLM